LVIDEPMTDKLKAEYPCWCGAKKCRGTLLASSAELSAPAKAAKAPKARSAKKR
jgi:hypothetical protein